MRIGIDVRYLSHALMGGVHTYLSLLVPALIERARGAEIFLYADSKARFEIETASLPPHVSVRILPYVNALSAFKLDFTLRNAMAADGIDVAHFPANFGFAPPGARSVITLHDAINIMPLWEILWGHEKTPRTMALMTYLHFVSTLSVRRADVLITVSEYSRREIIRRTRLPEDRVIAVKYGPAPIFRRFEDRTQLEEVRTRLGVQRPFLLADAIKNPDVIARAWQRLPETMQASHQMLFFSRLVDPPAPVQAMVAAGHAQVLIRPSRSDLVALFNLAEGFLFPSLYEGLGLPPIEAMKCGAPVIASDRGSIPEVVGDAGIIIDAQDDAALAAHITRLLQDRAFHQELQQRGLARAEEFSWPKPADRILDAYWYALSLPPKGRAAPVEVSS
ncbi:MAG TPA: glycosyltransferase family 1 protein [Chloroflexi bacterium]|nr:glycosyltransferase family 1 protein [Chloroflexota bacterium]